MALSDILYNFQTDPNRNKKIAVTVGWVVVITVFVLGFMFVNGLSSKDDPAQKTDTLTSQSLLESLAGDKDFKTKFPKGPDLKLVSDKGVVNNGSFAISSRGEPVHLSNGNRFYVSSQEVGDFPILSPLSVYESQYGYFVNDYVKGVNVVSGNQIKVIPNATEIGQVIPLNTGVDQFGFASVEEYFFVTFQNEGFTLQKSNSLQLDAPIPLGDFKNVKPDTFPYYQMLKVKGGIVIAFYENPAQQGNAEFWMYKNNRLANLFAREKVWSVNAQDNYLMITYQKPVSEFIANYDNEIFNLSSTGASKIDLTPSFLLQQREIYGNVLARRCTIPTTNQLYCLVKERPRRADDPTVPDLIVKFNIDSATVQIIGDGAIPAASGILVDIKSNQIFVVKQDDQKLYSLKL